MGISLSGGPFSYNRFDDYQAMINEKKADKDYDGDGKVESSKEEYFGSKDKAIKKAMANEEKVRSAKVETEKKMEKGLDKGAKTQVDEHQMGLYVRALGRMGMNYVGHPISEKKKDDEPTDERKEAADRADEEKRQKKEGKKGEAHETKELEKIEDKELSKEAFEAGWNAAQLDLPEEKVAQAKKMSEKKLEKGLDKDTHSEAFDAGYIYCINEGGAGAGSPGKMVASVKKEVASNKKETDAMKYDDAKQRRQQAKNAAESFVMQHLIDEGLATNEVSAETIMLHMSDEWYQHIVEMGPAYPSETKAQATAQKDHREGKSAKGEKTGKNPGLKMSHTSGYNKQD